jgi:hypothetical protein
MRVMRPRDSANSFFYCHLVDLVPRVGFLPDASHYLPKQLSLDPLASQFHVELGELSRRSDSF